MKNRISLFAFLLLSAISVTAQQEQGDPRELDTLAKQKNFKLAALPIVFYTPETEFGFGGGGQLFLLNNTNEYNNRLSSIFFSAIYTSVGQIIFNVTPEVYLAKGNYQIDADYLFEIYPNSFWGIGPDTPEDNIESYNQTTHRLEVTFLKRLPPDLNFGFSYYFANHEVTEIAKGGLLDAGDILGSDRAILSGLGAQFNLDSRDDAASATSGSLLEFGARFSAKVLGATHSFNKFTFDLRHYKPLTDKSTFAAQLYVESNLGDVPFQGMAYYGGGNRARGYFNGRFIDKNMYVVQGEYRYRFKPRWAIAAFGLFGSVANDIDELFSFNTLKPAFGGGIRFKILKDQNTWVRLDIGSGKDGQSGIYFGVNESF